MLSLFVPGFELTGVGGTTCRSRSRSHLFFSSSLSKATNAPANLQKLLLARVPPQADVVDAFFVVLRFAIDHCVLRLEVTGLVNGLAERASAVLGDADVQRGGAVCHEIPLKSNTANQGISRFLVTGTGQKIVTGSRNPHVWLRFEYWRREWDSNPLENSKRGT
jgi:hypothetical protein